MLVSLKQVGWNGIDLSIPHSWETIVSGHYHLIFENDFVPHLELRWEKTGPLTEKEILNRGRRLWPDYHATLPSSKSHHSSHCIENNFSFSRYYTTAGNTLAGGISFCQSCRTLLIFQFLEKSTTSRQLAETIASSIVCHADINTPVTYRLQDFSFQIQSDFHLQDYTFQAGLTRLGFTGPPYTLQICKLSQADRRLVNQDLKTMLATLAGSSDLNFVEEEQSCIGFRSPPLGRQILYRLRRQPPFISAKISHRSESNRLLAVVLSSKSALDEKELHRHCQHYEDI